MLECCNIHFTGSFSYILISNTTNYHKIEFGRCPQCNQMIFKDFNICLHSENIKIYKGQKADNKYKHWKMKLANQKTGSYSNQNVYYGDFRRTRRVDNYGNPIYLQLKKNFNGQSEILGEIVTIQKEF